MVVVYIQFFVATVAIVIAGQIAEHTGLGNILGSNAFNKILLG